MTDIALVTTPFDPSNSKLNEVINAVNQINRQQDVAIVAGSPQDVFSTVAVAGQDNIVADAETDTLTIVAGTGITITTNAASDSITINATGGTDDQTAAEVSFDPTGLTHTAATNVQEAVADIEGAIISPNAVDHLFDATGLVHTTATNVQVAIEELDAAIGSDTNGSTAGVTAGIAVEEVISGALHKTILTFTNAALVLADDGANGAFGSVKLYNFPRGLITRGVLANLATTLSAAGVSDTWSGNCIFGVDAVIDSTGFNASQAYFDPINVGPAVAGVLQIVKAGNSGIIGGAAAVSNTYTVDASTTFASDNELHFIINVNLADQSVAITPTNIILNGTATILWSNNGDY